MKRRIIGPTSGEERRGVESQLYLRGISGGAGIEPVPQGFRATV